MLLYNFRNYADFKLLFGYEIHGNGEKSRKNKILLAHLKNPALIRYCREYDDWSLLRVRTMQDLKKVTLEKIQESGKNDLDLPWKVNLIGMTFYSSLYKTDEKEGLCEDLDGSSIRYINVERGNSFKMKSGKFISKLIRETELGKILKEQVINWLSEEFSMDWSAFTKFHQPEVELHIDDDFKKIYSSRWCKDFHGNSCMMDHDHWQFYRDSVEAKAAYITDAEGYILSRAILYTNVTDQFGNKHRLLERQYSRNSDSVLSRLLIEACIREAQITGYKTVGAACSDARNFVSPTGESLAHLIFRTPVELGMEDIISYQDSFKYFDYDGQIAYNTNEGLKESCILERLDTTYRNLEGDSDEDDDDEGEYDEYHDDYVEETTLCYLHGHEIYVDIERLDDFETVNGEYHHVDDLVYCDHCGKPQLKDEAIEEKGDDSVFCCEECRKAYIEEKWYFSQWEEKYYPNEEDLTIVLQWNSFTQSYGRLTISREALERLKREGLAFGFGNIWIMSSEAVNAEVA